MHSRFLYKTSPHLCIMILIVTLRALAVPPPTLASGKHFKAPQEGGSYRERLQIQRQPAGSQKKYGPTASNGVLSKLSTFLLTELSKQAGTSLSTRGADMTRRISGREIAQTTVFQVLGHEYQRARAPALRHCLI